MTGSRGHCDDLTPGLHHLHRARPLVLALLALRGEIKECPADEVAFDAAEHYRIWHTDGQAS